MRRHNNKKKTHERRKKIDWKEISNLQQMITKWTFQSKQSSNKNQSEAPFKSLWAIVAIFFFGVVIIAVMLS